MRLRRRRRQLNRHDPDEPESLRRHWDTRYGSTGATEGSWFEPTPATSIELIDAVAAPGDPKTVIDIGAGTSRLVDELTAHGDVVTVLDISQVALDDIRATARSTPSGPTSGRGDPNTDGTSGTTGHSSTSSPSPTTGSVTPTPSAAPSDQPARSCSVCSQRTAPTTARAFPSTGLRSMRCRSCSAQSMSSRNGRPPTAPRAVRSNRSSGSRAGSLTPTADESLFRRSGGQERGIPVEVERPSLVVGRRHAVAGRVHRSAGPTAYAS